MAVFAALSSDPSASPRPGAVPQLLAELRDMIRAEGLVTGDSLPTERELAERFGVARNTMREAIGVLRAYGVVEVRPKVGAVLINRHLSAALDVYSFQLAISPETFADIQGFRQLVELGLFDLLQARLTQEDLDALAAHNADMLDAPTVPDCAAADYAFHHRLVTIAGNATLTDVYRIMQPVILRLMETGKATRGRALAHESHARIIQALRDGDRLAYQYFMADHLRQGLGFVGTRGEEGSD